MTTHTTNPITISILYFARFREQLDCESEQLTIDAEPANIETLIKSLSARGDNWQKIFTEDNLLVALNQTKCTRNATISDGDEVAFFPPVTGG